MNLLIAAALAVGLSDASYVRMGRMAAEPTIDGRISMVEAGAASTHYGAISQTDGYMAMRYAVFHVGYTEKGIYFAARTSVPKLPQTLTDDDTVVLTLLPPGAERPRSFAVRTKDGRGDLPDGVVSAAQRLNGVVDYGELCTETELFVPFSALGDAKVEDGAKWGLQMSVNFSSERETATWHYADGRPGELGTLEMDSSAPTISLVNYYTLEQWRQSGNYRFLFRYVNNSPKAVKVGSKTVFHRGIHAAKLDSGSERDVATTAKRFADIGGFTLRPGESKEVIHIEWVIWPGKPNTLNVDLEADGRTAYRRQIAWDGTYHRRWKDEKGLPNLKTAFFPSSNNRLRMRYHKGRIGDLVSGVIEVRGVKSGKTFWRTDLRPASGRRHLDGETFDINLPSLPEDDYRVTFSATDAKGEAYSHVRTFQVKSFPWQTAEIGMERTIVPPYVPICVNEARGTLSCLWNGYGWGNNVLWDSLVGNREELLAAPMRLELNGREFTVTGSRLAELSQDRVIREVNAELDGIGLTVRQDYDYDGFCWVALEFDAKKPVEVKSLRISAPLKNAFAKYFEVQRREDRRSGPAPDFTLPAGEGEVWNSRMNVGNAKWWDEHFPASIQPYFWFGGAFKGLAWIMDGVRDLSLERDVAPQRVVRKGLAATYELDLVNKPITWQGKKRFEMGWQPTPTRPKDPAHGEFASLMYSYACPSNAIRYELEYSLTLDPIHSPDNVYPGNDRSFYDWVYSQKTRINKPYGKWDCTEYRRRMKEYIARHREWFAAEKPTSGTDYWFGKYNCARGMGVDMRLRYLDPMLITSFWPEWEMYKAEWFPEEWSHDDYFNEYMAQLCKTRIDKLMWDGRNALLNGAGGLYYDCYRIAASWNLGNENVYVKPDGTIQMQMGNILKWRDIMKRSAVLCHSMGRMYNGRPVVEDHDTNGHIIPTMSWAMLGLSTERSSQGGDFQDRFPESYTLTEITGGQTGKGTRFIVSTNVGDDARRNRELISLMSYMCAYGLFALNDQGVVGGNERFEKAWNRVFDFGWGKPHVEQFQYWNEYKVQPVTHTGRNIRLTVAKKEGSALLLFGNLGDAETFTFDEKGLGFGSVSLVDAETGEALASREITVGRHDFRQVLVTETSKPTPAKPDVLCIYYPEWHTYPEGDRIFGKGRTEWDFVNSARPMFDGHEQPVELVDGNPDDSDPGDVAKEIGYAADAGINVFVYDWYWADGKPIQHEALERGYLNATNRGKVKFALMWANHNRSDVFRSPPRHSGDRFFWRLKYTREEFLDVIRYCIGHYFCRPEYYRKDGELFFSVYSVKPLMEGVGGSAALRAVFDEAQAMVRQAGLPPIHFSAMVHHRNDIPGVTAAGFRSASAYNVTPYDFDDTDVTATNGETRQVFTHEQYAKAHIPFNAQFAADRDFVPYIPVVCRGWDCTPRCRQDEPFPFRTLSYPYLGVISGMKPGVFGGMVRSAIEQAMRDPKRPGAILINAWNEYTEGSYLMPDRRHGDAFLKALSSAVEEAGRANGAR